MAARYWVGGTGNWSDAANHWSDTSGGTPGAGFLPTSGDDVYFDDNSATGNFTLTITANADCKNMDWSGIVVGVVFQNTVNQAHLNIYGSLALSNRLSFTGWISQRYLTFKATTNEIINFNGGNLNNFHGIIEFNGVGGKWTIQNNGSLGSVSGGVVWLYNGELDINNCDVSTSAFYIGAGVKTLTLGTGTIRTRSIYISNATDFTFNYNTGLVYIGLYRTGQIHGSLTFYNLTLEAGTNLVADAIIELNQNITVLNNLIINGTNSTNDRLLVKNINSFLTAQITITAENVTCANADFLGIVGAGNADWDLSAITGGAGDGGGNSGIIFTPPKTCYWYGNGGNWSDTTKWFSATNGGGTPDYFPILHDSVIFDANSLSEPSTIVFNYAQIGNITFADITSALILNCDSVYRTPYYYSSIYLSELVTYMAVGSYQSYLLGRGIHYLDLKGVNFKFIYIYAQGATYILLSKLLGTGLMFSKGTFDTDSYVVELDYLSSSGTLYLRNSYVLIKSGGASPLSLFGGFNAGTSTIEITTPVGTSDYTIHLYNSPKTFNDVVFSGAGTGYILIPTYGRSHTFNKLTIMPGRKVKFYYYPDLSIRFNFKEFIANGTVSEPITITSDGAGQHYLHCTGYEDISVSYCDISYSKVTGTPRIKTILGKTWASINKAAGIAKSGIKRIMGINVNSAWIANNSTDSGNNSGWNFMP